MISSKQIEPNLFKTFEIIQILGESPDTTVWKAIHKTKKMLVAIKRITDVYRSKASSQRLYREMNILSYLQGHNNIVSFYEASVSTSSEAVDVYLVFEYVQSDLEKLLRARLLKETHIEYIMYKMLKSLLFIHSKYVVHRDIKPSNVLVDKFSEPKLADFGLARTLTPTKREEFLELQRAKERGHHSSHNASMSAFLQTSFGAGKSFIAPDGTQAVGEVEEVLNLTDYVTSRWYRAPEILLGSVEYSFHCDIWSLGCVFGEMLLGRVLFQGSSTLNQLEKIFEVIGRPSENDLEAINSPSAKSLLSAVEVKHQIGLDKLFENFPPSAQNLISGLLCLNPQERLTARDALNHLFLSNLLADEPWLPNYYNDETKVVLELDDNVLYSIKNYQESIGDFIEQNVLKERRFQLKARMAETEIARIKASENQKKTDEKTRQSDRVPKSPRKLITRTAILDEETDRLHNQTQPTRRMDPEGGVSRGEMAGGTTILNFSKTGV